MVNWEEHYDDQNNLYYYNPETGESQWEKPESPPKPVFNIKKPHRHQRSLKKVTTSPHLAKLAMGTDLSSSSSQLPPLQSARNSRTSPNMGNLSSRGPAEVFYVPKKNPISSSSSAYGQTKPSDGTTQQHSPTYSQRQSQSQQQSQSFNAPLSTRSSNIHEPAAIAMAQSQAQEYGGRASLHSVHHSQPQQQQQHHHPLLSNSNTANSMYHIPGAIASNLHRSQTMLSPTHSLGGQMGGGGNNGPLTPNSMNNTRTPNSMHRFASMHSLHPGTIEEVSESPFGSPPPRLREDWISERDREDRERDREREKEREKERERERERERELEEKRREREREREEALLAEKEKEFEQRLQREQDNYERQLQLKQQNFDKDLELRQLKTESENHERLREMERQAAEEKRQIEIDITRQYEERLRNIHEKSDTNSSNALSSLRQEYEEKLKSCRNQINELKELSKDNDVLSEELRIFGQRESDISAKYEDMMQRNEGLLSKLQNEEATSIELRGKIDELTLDLNTAQSNAEDYRNSFEKANEELNKLRKANEDSIQDDFKRTEECSKLDARIEALTEQLELMETRAIQAETISSDVQSELENVKRDEANSSQMVIELKAELKDAIHTAEEFSVEVEQLRKDLKIERERSESLQKELSELKEKHMELEKCGAVDSERHRREIMEAELKYKPELDIARNQCEELNGKLREVSIENESLNKRLEGVNQGREELSSEVHQLKRSIEEEQHQVSDLRIQLKSAKDEVAEISDQRASLRNSLEASDQHSRKLNEDLEQRVATIDTLKEEMKKCEKKLEASTSLLKEMTERSRKLKSDRAELQERRRILKQEKEALSNELTKAKEKMEYAQKQLLRKEAELSTTVGDLNIVTTENERLKEALDHAESRANFAEEKASSERTARRNTERKLANLQGNISVFCRARPLLAVDHAKGISEPVVFFPSSGELLVNDSARGSMRFEFDHVFECDTQQESVFNQTEYMIRNAVEGYNVCIFAYGQTGSGKTFTMEGSPENPGLNPRTLQYLFDERDARRAHSDITFSISVFEIYNETIRDLLAPPSSARQGHHHTSSKGLDVPQLSDHTQIVGLSRAAVENIEEVENLLQLGNQQRHVGSHDMNEHSSRSHLILRVDIESVSVHDGAVTRSKLQLIDLAGSERLQKTSATGDRLKEAQNINRSLSALGDVIQALGDGNKDRHIPFRNSKLTFALQDSLGGRARVLMFVNISPAKYNSQETLCSLKFAQRCRSVQLGQSKRNTQSAEVTRLRKLVQRYEEQLMSYRRAR